MSKRARSKKHAKLTGQAPVLSHTSSFRIVEGSTRPRALDLPLELLMEILTYFRQIPIPNYDTEDVRVYHLASVTYLERVDILRSLSQTCKQWRVVFYPLLWERFEVAASHSESGAWYKVLGEALVRKGRLVANNPQIACHVRFMTVSLTRYQPQIVLKALFEAIDCLPNLDTLHIVRTHTKMTNMIKDAVAGKHFLQVRTVILPTNAHHILRCCPNVRTVICKTRDEGSQLVTAINMFCKKVEAIRGIRADKNVIKRLVKAAPNLRSIEFDLQVDARDIEALAGAKKLDHIQFGSIHPTFDAAMSIDANNIACVKIAKEAMRKSPGKKTIVVKHTSRWGWEPNEYGVAPWSRKIEFEV